VDVTNAGGVFTVGPAIEVEDDRAKETIIAAITILDFFITDIPMSIKCGKISTFLNTNRNVRNVQFKECV
jgi:hypothetical protein